MKKSDMSFFMAGCSGANPATKQLQAAQAQAIKRRGAHEPAGNRLVVQSQRGTSLAPDGKSFCRRGGQV